MARNLRARVDIDYAGKLSPSERAWLDRFVDCFYAGDMRSATEETWTPEQRREAWLDQRISREDAFGLSCLGGGPDELPIHQTEQDGKDWAHTPGYLEDPDYKTARAEFRARLAKTRRWVDPVQTLEFLRARKHLDVITPAPPAKDLPVRPRPKSRRSPAPTPRKPKR